MQSSRKNSTNELLKILEERKKLKKCSDIHEAERQQEGLNVYEIDKKHNLIIETPKKHQINESNEQRVEEASENKKQTVSLEKAELHQMQNIKKAKKIQIKQVVVQRKSAYESKSVPTSPKQARESFIKKTEVLPKSCPAVRRNLNSSSSLLMKKLAFEGLLDSFGAENKQRSNKQVAFVADDNVADESVKLRQLKQTFKNIRSIDTYDHSTISSSIKPNLPPKPNSKANADSLSKSVEEIFVGNFIGYNKNNYKENQEYEKKRGPPPLPRKPVGNDIKTKPELPPKPSKVPQECKSLDSLTLNPAKKPPNLPPKPNKIYLPNDNETKENSPLNENVKPLILPTKILLTKVAFKSEDSLWTEIKKKEIDNSCLDFNKPKPPRIFHILKKKTNIRLSVGDSAIGDSCGLICEKTI
ncbi:hypothetical protein HDU92_006103 [Lobulomyces angularis]|nr:hypothetical protein HDU92_006103 [Lobulomyces angularis]